MKTFFGFVLLGCLFLAAFLPPMWSDLKRLKEGRQDATWLRTEAAPGDYTMRSAPGSIVVRKYRDGGLADVTDPLRPVQFGFGGFEGSKWVEVKP